MLLSVEAGGDEVVDPVDAEVDAPLGRVLPNIDCDATPFAALFEALVAPVPLHPVSRVEARSREQTTHELSAPMTRPS
jgi:hypothetical protein